MLDARNIQLKKLIVFYLLTFLSIQPNSLSSAQETLPSCPSPPKEVGLSESEKKEVLDLHNKYRRDVLHGRVKGLPKAREMETLVWDKDLEEEAQRWALLCPDFNKGFAHPPESWLKFPYGQNMGWGHKNILASVKAWFDEYEDYVEKGIDPLIYRDDHDKERVEHQLGQIGHFTAIVNANSSKIGCTKVSSDQYRFRVIYTCDYSPRGNILLQKSSGVIIPQPAYVIDTSPAVDDKKDDKDESFEAYLKTHNLTSLIQPSDHRPKVNKLGDNEDEDSHVRTLLRKGPALFPLPSQINNSSQSAGDENKTGTDQNLKMSKKKKKKKKKKKTTKKTQKTKSKKKKDKKKKKKRKHGNKIRKHRRKESQSKERSKLEENEKRFSVVELQDNMNAETNSMEMARRRMFGGERMLISHHGKETGGNDNGHSDDNIFNYNYDDANLVKNLAAKKDLGW